MSTTNAFQPLQPATADPQSPRPGRGLMVLLVSGLAVLAASAAAGRYYWTDENPRAAVNPPSLIPEGYAPQVWIWSHEENAPQGFAGLAPPEVPLITLPGHAPLPRLTESYVASQTPVVAHTPDAATTGPQPLPAAPRRAEVAAPETDGNSAPRPVMVLASLPPLVPPQRPIPAPAVAASALDSGETAPAQAEPGLARSLLPQPRPENVRHLASLAAAAPTAPTPVAQPQATPAPTTLAAALDVPPLAGNGRDSCPATLTRAIPRRPAGAPGGQNTIARLAASAGAGRDNAVAQAVISGNMPDFLRQLVPVTVSGTGADGRQTRITLCVMPDYLAVGDDNDFVRVPLGLPAASLIAERFDMVLPTTRMVDAIHTQARVRLRPSPMTPGAQMASTDYFLRHNATLEGQRRSAGGTLGMLVSGHKKDLVLSNRLERNPGRVAIYGWHQANGQPIQPLSTVHGASYADYSHGIRLVSRTAFINGQAIDLRDLLGDGRYAGLISDEGTITSRLMLAALR